MMYLGPVLVSGKSNEYLDHNLTSALAPSGNIYDVSGPSLGIYLEFSISGP